MNPLLQLVQQMHTKFGIEFSNVPFSEREKEFRHAAMLEEVTEYLEAKTAEDELDALVDLVVFALGTVERQGWTEVFEEAFNRVMKANLQKEVGPNQKRGSFALDLVKPEGWEAADLTDLVKKPDVPDFTHWLFTIQESDQETDPVNLFKMKYSKEITWPTGVKSLEELEQYIENKLRKDLEHRLKGELYTARLAWKDYEESVV